MAENDKPPKKEAGDVAHSLVKAALSAVPVVGGSAAELFALVIAPPLEKRRAKWLEDLASRLSQLEQQFAQMKLENLANNEQFLSATLQASQIAVRTHEHTKREALLNAVSNIAIGRTLDEEKQAFFLSLLDSFTVMHIDVLRLLDNWAGSAVERRTELSGRRELVDPIVLDLNSRGLLNDPRPIAAHNRDSAEPLVSQGWRLTHLGKQFLEFISRPR